MRLLLALLFALATAMPALADTGGFALSRDVIFLIQPAEEHKLALLDWDGHWITSIGTEEPNQPDTIVAPVELLTDASGNCFVLDQFGPAIIHVNASGKVIRRWGERGFERGQMRKPVDFGLDAHGKLYVLDLGREAVLRFTTAGTFINELPLASTDTEQLSWSTAIAVEPEGQFMLVADQPGVEGLLRKLTRYSEGGDRLGQLTVAKADTMGAITDLAVLPGGKLIFVDHQFGTGSAYAGALYRFSGMAELEARIFLSDPDRGVAYSPMRIKLFGGAMYVLTNTNEVVRISGEGIVERRWGR